MQHTLLQEDASFDLYLQLMIKNTMRAVLKAQGKNVVIPFRGKFGIPQTYLSLYSGL